MHVFMNDLSFEVDNYLGSYRTPKKGQIGNEYIDILHNTTNNVPKSIPIIVKSQ